MWLNEPLSSVKEAQTVLQNSTAIDTRQYQSPSSLLHDRTTQELLKHGIPSEGLWSLYALEASESRAFQEKLNRRRRVPPGLAPLDYIRHMEIEIGVDCDDKEESENRSVMVQMVS